MRVELSRYAGLSVALLACAMVGACKGERQRAAMTDTTASETSAAAGTVAPAESGAAGGGAALSDANILALLDEANMADSASAAMALPKARSADVKDFARLMMGEHHALRVQGEQLAQQLNITPQLPANDPLKPAVQAEADSLQGKTGAEFDRTYIAQEILIHQAVLDLAGKARDQTQNAQLKALITKAAPVIQKHLDRAQAIQQKLETAS